MEYLKKLFDITAGLVFSAWPILVLGVAVIGGILEYMRLSATVDLPAVTRYLESLKVSAIAVIIVLLLTVLFYAPYRAWLDENNAHTAVQAKLDIRLQKEKVRKALSVLQGRATTLIGRFGEAQAPNKPLPLEELNDYEKRLHLFLNRALGIDYVTGLVSAGKLGGSPFLIEPINRLIRYRDALQDYVEGLRKENWDGSINLDAEAVQYIQFDIPLPKDMEAIINKE